MTKRKIPMGAGKAAVNKMVADDPDVTHAEIVAELGLSSSHAWSLLRQAKNEVEGLGEMSQEEFWGQVRKQGELERSERVVAVVNRDQASYKTSNFYRPKR